MERYISSMTPLYKRSNDFLWYIHNKRLYEIGSYTMETDITFVPAIGNVELKFHHREFNMITLNNLSLLSLFSEAYNYKISQFFNIHSHLNVDEIIEKFELNCDDCKYAIIPLGELGYYIFIFKIV